MQIKNIFTVLAAGLTLASATKPVDVEEDITTTSTSTMTQTVTITECNPTNTACPGYWPKTNSTSAAPTWFHNATSWAIPTGTGKPAVIQTSIVSTAAPTKPATTVPVTTSGANGLFLQSGLLLGIVGAGVALIA
ncbi:hypothetical protein OQA88_1601 [Cercophora sp. LCS_1]